MHSSSAKQSPNPPGWVKDAVFYQIFPDRFAKSAHLPKPAHLQPWGSRPTDHGYMGGDLVAVAEHLDYLTDLGINAIYLNPVFQSASNHRYHTHDYFQVDPLLGGNQALRALVDRAHSSGVRIVLDGVFNHASRGFFQFHDILENGQQSPWLDWFVIERWPLAPYDFHRPPNYACWWGNRALPKFNTDNDQVREFLMGVGEYWLREFDIDGWRIDVPKEIRTPGFWEEFRTRVRAIKPDAYIVGEIWHAAPEWLAGDRFDAVMNYLFAAAVIAFVAGDRVSPALVEGREYDPYPPLDAAQFGQRIDQLLGLYEWETSQALLNLLDSHDTARLISLSRGDTSTVRLATLFQMTYPGAPCVYYGDEVGLRGSESYDEPFRDCEARFAFPWHDREQWDESLLAYFKQAIALRHAHPVLRHGRFEQLYGEKMCFAFARRSQDRGLIVALNAGEQEAELSLPVGHFLDDGAELQQLFGLGTAAPVRDGHLALILPARNGLVVG